MVDRSTRSAPHDDRSGGSGSVPWLALAWAVSGLVGFSGCGGDECTRARDCPTGQFCQNGQCVEADAVDARDDGMEVPDVDVGPDGDGEDRPEGEVIDIGPDGAGCEPATCTAACQGAGFDIGTCFGEDCLCNDVPDAGDADADGDADGDGDADVPVPECTVETAAVDCNDGNVCTVDACDGVTRTCYHYAVFEGTSCDDGVYCNGVEQCRAGACVTAYAVCTGHTGCIVETCNEATDSCSSTVSPDGTTCESPTGGFCDGSYTCQHGYCMFAGAACPEPDPPVPCMAMQCTEATDTCTLAPGHEGADCSSGPVTGCSPAGICSGGTCITGTSPCDDLNPCTTETCTVAGTGHTCSTPAPVADGTACDDARVCTGTGQTCRAGRCAPVATAPCNDSNLCTADPCTEGSPPTCGTHASRAFPTVACDSSAGLYGAPGTFVGYEYFTYGTSCAGTYPGPESGYALTLAASSHVVIRLVGGGTGARVLLLNNGCSATSCRAIDAAGTIDAGTLPAGTYTIMGDTTGALPGGATIEVDCS